MSCEGQSKLEGEIRMKQEKTATDVIKAKRGPARGNAAGGAGKRTTDTRLEIPVGQPDLTALRSVTHEWLVPRLVQEFLRERGIEVKQSPMSVNYENPIPKPLSRGGRGARFRRER
jgi:hypothetical protein